MAVYDLRGLTADFVVHYGGDEAQIDAFTFGNSLIALGDALQAASRDVNPGYALEISVMALGGGSFRPQIRGKAKKIGGLIASEFRTGFVAAVAGLVVVRCFGAAEPTTIINEEQHNVEIHSDGGDVIILPLEAFREFEKIKDSPDVKQSIRRAFEVLEEDEGVTSFGFARDPDERENLPFQIDRSQFCDVARPVEPLAENEQEVVENADLQIVRAIFEDSSRRWQFVWRGVKISAPVLDKGFRERVVRGEESFRHGDVLIVELRIVQRADDSGIWINEAYEVVTVLGHERRPHQQSLLND